MRRKFHQKKPFKGISLTVSADLVDMGGYIILAKDQKVTVTDVYYDEAGYDIWGYFHKEKWTSVCLKEEPGFSWSFSAFKDTQALQDVNFIEWLYDKKYKFHHGGWYSSGQSATTIRTFQQLYLKYGDEQERAKWNEFVRGFEQNNTRLT